MRSQVLKVNFEDVNKKTKTPFLTHCRKLLEEGYPENTRVWFFRNKQRYPDVIVPSIGISAQITVRETQQVGPGFVKMGKGYTGSPKKQIDKLEVPVQ